MAGIAAAGNGDVRGRGLGCFGKTAAVGMAAAAVLGCSFQDTALVTAFAFGIIVGTRERETGFGVVECRGRGLRFRRIGDRRAGQQKCNDGTGKHPA